MSVTPTDRAFIESRRQQRANRFVGMIMRETVEHVSAYSRRALARHLYDLAYNGNLEIVEIPPDLDVKP